MKTIREWLEELPEPYRSQALKGTYWERKETKVESLIDALIIGCPLRHREEGLKYWTQVLNTLNSTHGT